MADQNSATARFLSNLQVSQLLTPNQFAEVSDHRAGLVEGLEPKQFADELVRRGWITRWQADQLLAGRTEFLLGKYKLIERLGKGGMGTVFKAEHTILRRTVALKAMSKELMEDSQAVVRFQREARAAAALEHPNIVAAFDADCSGDTYFLAMEFVEGQDLAYWIRHHGRLPIADACECVRQAAAGLQHAFEQEMIHRDLKPANLMVTRAANGNAVIKILDMGLARFMSETRSEQSGLTMAGQLVGTPEYMAPEQARDAGTADIRADIYSLGCVLYELLTGQQPFKGETMTAVLMARLMQDAAPVRTLRAEIPDALSMVVEKMLAREPEDRYQTPQEVVDALTPFSTGGEDLSFVDRAAAPVEPLAAVDPSQIQILGAHARVNLRPTLILGIGETGVRSLERIRHRFRARFQDYAAYDWLAFLGVDTDPKVVHEVARTEPVSDAAYNDFLPCRLRKPTEYLNVWDQLSQIHGWLQTDSVASMPESGMTNGYRLVGRLALILNYREVLGKIAKVLEKLMRRPDAFTDPGLARVRWDYPRIVVIAGMGGGAGSGMFLDMCYLAGMALRLAGAQQTDVQGCLVGGLHPAESKKELRAINHYALLRELAIASEPGFNYSVKYEHASPFVRHSGPPAQGVYFFDAHAEHLPQPARSATLDALSDFVSHLVGTQMGSHLEDFSRAEHWPIFRSAGLFSLVYPGRDINHQLGLRLCQDLIARWSEPAGDAPTTMINTSLEKWLADAGLSPEPLRNRLLDDCSEGLDKRLDLLALDRVAQLESQMQQAGKQDVRPLCLEALQDIGKWLGTELLDGGKPSTPPLLEQRILAATKKNTESAFADFFAMMTRKIEEPGAKLDTCKLLSNACGKYFLRMSDKLKQTAQTNKEGLNETIADARQKFKGVDSSWFGKAKARQAFADALRLYVSSKIWHRLQTPSAQIYLSLQGKISDVQYDLVSILHSLEQAREGFRAASGAPEPLGAGFFTVVLFPGNIPTMEETVAQLESALTGEPLSKLEMEIQERTFAPHGGFWRALREGGMPIEAVAENMLSNTYQWLRRVSPQPQVTELFFHAVGAAETTVGAELRSLVETAQPITPATQLTSPFAKETAPREVFFVSVPESESGRRFAESVVQFVPELPARFIADEEQCCLCRIALYPKPSEATQWYAEARGLYENAWNSRLTPRILPPDFYDADKPAETSKNA